MEQHHFLVATFPAQGHLNPSLHLAKRLAHITGGHVTFSTSISGHRRMFPSSDPNLHEFHHDLLTHIPFFEGHDAGLTDTNTPFSDFLSDFKLHGSRSLSAILRSLAARGRPVTCLVYTILVPWAADVARDHDIPSALYWIQASTVFAIYHRYFHGHEALVAAHADDPLFEVKLPGLQSLRIRDLPSFFTMSLDHKFYAIGNAIRELFETLERDKRSNNRRLSVLVNSFAALEADAVKTMEEEIELMPIGPLFPSLLAEFSDAKEFGGLFNIDEKDYMEWLNAKLEASVVYISFGSFSTLKEKQMKELIRGLKESKRPYLWVVRKDSRPQGTELDEESEEGMVVEWCSQVRVLSHPAVGCFVSHCGWNSTLESLVYGVPMVCFPEWTDQGTNAKLVEDLWGTGVRAEVNEEGVYEGEELKRCLDMVMGEEEAGVKIRERAKMWRNEAAATVKEGGSSDRNLKAFLNEIQKH